MRSRVGWIGGLVVGFFLGLALVVACTGRRGGGGGDDGGLFDAGRDAHAQEGGCSRWEVASVHYNVDGPHGELESGEPYFELPSGWEPFSLYDFNGYGIRRCAD